MGFLILKGHSEVLRLVESDAMKLFSAPKYIQDIDGMKRSRDMDESIYAKQI